MLRHNLNAFDSDRDTIWILLQAVDGPRRGLSSLTNLSSANGKIKPVIDNLPERPSTITDENTLEWLSPLTETQSAVVGYVIF